MLDAHVAAVRQHGIVLHDGNGTLHVGGANLLARTWGLPLPAPERVGLVHTGLRDMLPPGGLSLCPVDADAGAHGVLLGDPLASLIAARASALQPRRELHGRFGRSVALNAALMVGAALRGAPPWAITAARHGANFLLLEQSARLARHSTPIPAAAPHRSTSNRCEDEPHPQENR